MKTKVFINFYVIQINIYVNENMKILNRFENEIKYKTNFISTL